MATLFPVAGAKISIGPVKASTASDFVASDFSAVSGWKLIDGWTNHGEVGDAAEVIRTSLINRGRVVKQKGSRDAGSMQNTFASLPTDEGQLALIAADATHQEYAFKIEYDDKPVVTAPDTSSPTILYFVALVNGTRNAGGGADTVRTLVTTLEINSNVVVVPAAIEEG